MAADAVGKAERRDQLIRPVITNQRGMGMMRVDGMLYCVLATTLSTEIQSRERKNLSDVSDSGNGPSPGYGWHVFQC